MKNTQRASPGNILPLLMAKVLLMALVETARPLFARNASAKGKIESEYKMQIILPKQLHFLYQAIE